jgi:hypothetical protein
LHSMKQLDGLIQIPLLPLDLEWMKIIN